MTFTPFNDDTGIQSFQGEVGFNPFQAPQLGDAYYQQFQQAEARRNLFDQSRAEQIQLSQANRQVSSTDLAKSFDLYQPLKDFLPTVSKALDKEVDKYIDKRIKEGYTEELNRRYIQRSQGQPQDPQEIQEVEKAQQSAQAGDTVIKEAQMDAARAGQFDLAEAVKGKNPYVAMGIAEAALDRYNSTYEADVTARLAEPRFANMTGQAGRERAMSIIRGEKMQELLQFNPALVDKKVFKQMLQTDGLVLSKIVRTDNANLGREARSLLPNALLRGEINPTEFLSQYAASSNIDGTGPVGNAAAWKALEDTLKANRITTNGLDSILDTVDPSDPKGRTIRESRPGFVRSVTIAQRDIERGDYQREQAEAGMRLEQALAPELVEIEKAGGITNDGLSQLRTGLIEQGHDSRLVDNALGGIKTIEQRSRERQQEEDRRIENDFFVKERQGLLTADDILNSNLSEEAKNKWLGRLKDSGTGGLGSLTAVDKAAKKAIEGELRKGQLRLSPDATSIPLLLMTEHAMKDYARRKFKYATQMSEADASALALSETRKWMIEQGAGIGGRTKVPNGDFSGKSDDLNHWNIMDRGGGSQNTAAAIQAQENYVNLRDAKRVSDAQGKDFLKEVHPSGRAYVLSRAEVDTMSANFESGKPVTLTGPMKLAMQLTSLNYLEILQRQREAYGLPRMESRLNSNSPTTGGYNVQEGLTRLSRYPTARRADRVLGSSSSGFNPADVPPVDGRPMGDTVAAAAQQYGVDPSILTGLIQQESGWRGGQTSRAGAQGIAQFMPATARQYGVDVRDPVSSINGAAKYLSYLLKRFNGDYRLAVTAYNAGEGNVERYGGPIPGNAESEDYWPSVLSHAYRFGYRNALADPGTMRPVYGRIVEGN